MALDRIPRFIAQLRRAIDLPARHTTAQCSYAPELAYGRHAGPAPRDARLGAVLVLFYPDPTDWNVVLTVRQSHLPTHAGQVSFPGGKIEPNELPEAAALREYEEEVGTHNDFTLLGRLPNVYVFASHFLVAPCVAITERKPLFQPNAHEVADVLTVSLSALADPARRGEHLIVRGPVRFSAPSFRLGSRHLWGATWLILGELLERLEAIGPLHGW